MYDLDALSRTYVPQQAAAPQQKKKKNFWLDQISTAGGILGGIGGSFIAPIAGTAGGAAAGSALGEAIEKMIDPNSTDWGNVAQEGIIGGIMGAGPLKLLKGGAAGAKALATGADDVVGAASKAAMTPLRQTAGKAVSGAADDLAVKNFRFTPTQLNNFKNKFGEDVGGVLRKYGIQNADDVALKGIEPLQQQFDDAIVGIAGVTRDSLKKNLMKRATALTKAGPSDSKALGKNLKSEIDSLLKGRGDVLDAKELNAIRRQFDDLVNYTEKAANPARYGVNKRMADGIRETLQQADQTGGLKTVGRELQKLRQLSDNISKQGQLGRGSLPLSIGNLPGAVMGAGAGGPGGAAAGYVANAIANSPTGRRVTMAGADKLGARLLQSGEKAAGQSMRGIAGRVGATGALRGLQGQQPETLEDALNQSLENRFTNDTTTNTSMNMPNNSAMMAGQYQAQQDVSSPFAPQNLESAIMQIMQQGGDMGDVSKFLTVAKTMQELTGGNQAQAKPLSQGQQERADLIKALDNTEGIMSTGSINYGPIGSRVEGVKSMFNAADPETLAFKNTVSGLRAAITKARAGASLTPGELKMLAQYTPSATDSEQVVRSKLAQLRGLYGYQAPTGGGSSLEDAIMQSQYSYQ